MQDIFEILESFFNSRLFLVLQILGGIVSVAFISAIVVLIKKGGALERHIKHLWISWKATPIPKHRMIKRWIAIKEAMETQDPSNWRAAIVDADSMMDEIFMKLGYGGDNIDQRLENILPEQFPSLSEAWRAHQIYSFLVEDPAYPLSREVANATIDIYRNIFRETGLIL